MSGRGNPATGERRLWLLWVLANAVGEAVGLGLTALVGAVAILSGGASGGLQVTLGVAALAVMALAVIALAVMAGALVEGTVVDTAQWSMLRRPLPRRMR